LRSNHETDRLTIIVDHSPDAVLEDHDVEIDQQSHGNIQQANMGEQLSVVEWVQCVFAFGLDYNSVFDDQVGPKATIKLYVFRSAGRLSDVPPSCPTFAVLGRGRLRMRTPAALVPTRDGL
jgi:hypothetical protein